MEPMLHSRNSEFRVFSLQMFIVVTMKVGSIYLSIYLSVYLSSHQYLKLLWKSIFFCIYVGRSLIDYRRGPAVRVFANGPGELGSIPGRVIPKTLKMELDTTLLNTQHYKVRFKGKVEQSWEWSSALPYTLV